ncbi:MAG: GntR family transcriptional regulator [Burkholderiaceae bacterium]
MSAVLKPGFGTNKGQPLYLVARDQLLKNLVRGAYPPGTALPPEKDLAADFGISIGTLRKGVDELVSEGLLVRQQGRGTFVAVHDQDRLLYYFFHVVALDGHKKSYPLVSLNRFSRGRAEAETAAKLNLDVGDPVFRLRNVLSLDGVVVMVDDISLAAAAFPRLTEARVRNRPGTLYQLYQEDYGHSVIRTSERLRAVAVPTDIAGLLKMAPASPVMMVRRVAMGYDNKPIEWRTSHIDTRLHEYINELGTWPNV